MTNPVNLRRRSLLQHATVAGAAWSVGAWGAASAASSDQGTWPNKPLRIVVPYPAGGVNDVLARQFADHLSRDLGQPCVVENRGGAGGTIGMGEMVRSTDAHTLSFAAISPLTLNPHIMKVTYDPLHDVVPVASVMYAPVYVLATSAFQGKDFAAALHAAKKNPDGVSVATSGFGTLAHIMVEQLRNQSAANFVHVPYKGGSQLITDAAGGQFDLLLANPFGPIKALIAEGKLRVLAVTGPARAASLPDIPTLGELGFSKANLTSMFGFYAPASTPATVIAKMHAAIQKILLTPHMQQRLKDLDNMPYPMGQAKFAKFVRDDYVANARVISSAAITAQ